ncbi:tRNA ligase [Nowakowskiella sp. JEL0407]|nr:tRNA ligase [Nowakowskiella sp. JEL0407]
MKWLAAVLLWASVVHAIKFELFAQNPPSKRCLRHFFHKDQLITGSAELSNADGLQRVDIEVFDNTPHRNKYYNKLDVNNFAKFSFTVLETGEVSFCFENSLITSARMYPRKNGSIFSFQNVNMTFYLNVDQPGTLKRSIYLHVDAGDVAPEVSNEKLSPLEGEFRRINGILHSVDMDMNYLIKREQEMRDTNETIGSRVKWFVYKFRTKDLAKALSVSTTSPLTMPPKSSKKKEVPPPANQKTLSHHDRHFWSSFPPAKKEVEQQKEELTEIFAKETLEIEVKSKKRNKKVISEDEATDVDEEIVEESPKKLKTDVAQVGEDEIKNDNDADQPEQSDLANEQKKIKRRKKKSKGDTSDDNSEASDLEVESDSENKSNRKSRKSASPKPVKSDEQELSDSESGKKKRKTNEEESTTANILSLSNDVTSNEKMEWEKGKSTPLEALCNVFQLCEETSERTKIIKQLTEYFHAVIKNSPDQCLLESVYLILNRLGPQYEESRKLGVAGKTLQSVIADYATTTVDDIRAKEKNLGDLGTVAETLGTNQTRFGGIRQRLTVSTVFKSLNDVANFEGAKSQDKKKGVIQKLLLSAKGNEVKFLVRMIAGTLRIGLAEKSIISALSHAFVHWECEIEGKSLSATKLAEEYTSADTIIRKVFSEVPSFDIVLPALKKHGLKKITEKCRMRPGVPIQPMLAQPTTSFGEVLEIFEGRSFTCEFKYDGERAQIHKPDAGKIRVFSRNLEDSAQKYLDVVENVSKYLKDPKTSFVIDAEVVAWDVQKKCILPFQVLSTRKRKGVSSDEIQVKVCIFAFDIVYVNGNTLIDKSLKERRDILFSTFAEVEGEFQFAQHMTSENVEDIQHFMNTAVEGNCEGLIVKAIDSTYELSKRSKNWLKLKKDYLDGVGDTLDLVVLGAYYGTGKRTGLFGGYLLGCYNDEAEEYQTICKIGTGFSDEILASHTKVLNEHIINDKKAYYNVTGTAKDKPDVWFEPSMVWEVKAADLSISPVYTAAIGLCNPSKGVSLRFPRFIRVRDDKTPENATTHIQVADMYNAQSINKSSKNVEDDC